MKRKSCFGGVGRSRGHVYTGSVIGNVIFVLVVGGIGNAVLGIVCFD